MPLTVPAPLEIVISSVVRNAQFRRVQAVNVAVGDNDLYTVPVGKRAYVGQVTLYNGGGVGTITRFLQVKVAGTYYRVSSSGTTATGVATNIALGLVLEPGDILSLNTSVANGMNGIAEVVEYDARSPLISARLLGLSTGDNTLYTCPAGFTAYVQRAGNAPGVGQSAAGNLIAVVADAGGTRAFFYHIVPSGQAVGTTFRMSVTVSPTASAASGIAGPGFGLGAGDFININVDTGAATEVAWVNVIQEPAR